MSSSQSPTQRLPTVEPSFSTQSQSEATYFIEFVAFEDVLDTNVAVQYQFQQTMKKFTLNFASLGSNLDTIRTSCQYISSSYVGGGFNTSATSFSEGTLTVEFRMRYTSNYVDVSDYSSRFLGWVRNNFIKVSNDLVTAGVEIVDINSLRYANTVHPTIVQTDAPTKHPTSAPTKALTSTPTKQSTSAPTKALTSTPIKRPTSAPTKLPSSSPTKKPTLKPTKSPSNEPSLHQSSSPTSSTSMFTLDENTTASPTSRISSSPSVSQKPSKSFSPTQIPTISSLPSISPNPVQFNAYRQSDTSKNAQLAIIFTAACIGLLFLLRFICVGGGSRNRYRSNDHYASAERSNKRKKQKKRFVLDNDHDDNEEEEVYNQLEDGDKDYQSILERGMAAKTTKNEKKTESKTTMPVAAATITGDDQKSSSDRGMAAKTTKNEKKTESKTTMTITGDDQKSSSDRGMAAKTTKNEKKTESKTTTPVAAATISGDDQKSSSDRGMAAKTTKNEKKTESKSTMPVAAATITGDDQKSSSDRGMAAKTTTNEKKTESKTTMPVAAVAVIDDDGSYDSDFIPDSSESESESWVDDDESSSSDFSDDDDSSDLLASFSLKKEVPQDRSVGTTLASFTGDDKVVDTDQVDDNEPDIYVAAQDTFNKSIQISSEAKQEEVEDVNRREEAKPTPSIAESFAASFLNSKSQNKDIVIPPSPDENKSDNRLKATRTPSSILKRDDEFEALVAVVDKVLSGVRLPPKLSYAPRFRRATSTDMQAVHEFLTLEDVAQTSADDLEKDMIHAKDNGVMPFYIILEEKDDDGGYYMMGLALWSFGYSTWKGRVMNLDLIIAGVYEHYMMTCLAKIAQSLDCQRLVHRAIPSVAALMKESHKADILHEWITLRMGRSDMTKLLQTKEVWSKKMMNKGTFGWFGQQHSTKKVKERVLQNNMTVKESIDTITEEMNEILGQRTINGSSNLRLRQATKYDARNIFEMVIELAAFEKAPKEVTVSPSTYKRDMGGPIPMFHCIIVESFNNKDLSTEVVGYCVFYLSYSPKGKYLWLEDLFIQEEYRRMGCGKAIMYSLAQIAMDRQCHSLKWQVLDWNKDALDFYEKLEVPKVLELDTLRFDNEKINQMLLKRSRSARSSTKESASNTHSSALSEARKVVSGPMS